MVYTYSMAIGVCRGGKVAREWNVRGGVTLDSRCGYVYAGCLVEGG